MAGSNYNKRSLLEHLPLPLINCGVLAGPGPCAGPSLGLQDAEHEMPPKRGSASKLPSTPTPEPPAL